jgi:hypothetical protein
MSVWNGRFDYTYDPSSQLQTAWAYNSSGSPITTQKFGYAFDPGQNLLRQTNNTTVSTFTPNDLNQLTGFPSNTQSFDGKQPRDGGSFYGPGHVLREPFNDFRDCREKKICPNDKERMCKEGPTTSVYFLPSPWHNCHAWANGRCK